jgi:hypothetical protein
MTLAEVLVIVDAVELYDGCDTLFWLDLCGVRIDCSILFIGELTLLLFSITVSFSLATAIDASFLCFDLFRLWM